MTVEEKLNEQDVQRQQLEKIFSLLNQHESDVGKMSENDLQNQLKMYKQQESSCSQKNNFRCLVNKTSLHVSQFTKNKPMSSFYKSLAKLLQFIQFVPALYNFFIDTTRGISILEEVRNVAISRPTQQLLQWYKCHDFLAIFALAHSKINQMA